MRGGRKPHPYVMPDRPRPVAPRSTSVDRADSRLEAVHVPHLMPEQLRTLERPGALDPRLRSTDRCFQRWASTPGNGGVLTQPARSRLFDSVQAPGVPALNDREAELVDEAVRTADAPEKHFVKLWSRSDATAAEMAELLGMRRRQSVYEERRLVLAYFRGRLTQMGLPLPVWTAET